MKNLNTSKTQGTTSTLFFNKVKLLTIACFTGFMLLFSCGGSDDVTDIVGCVGNGYNTELTNSLNNYISTGTTYYSNPSVANCRAFKTAITDFKDTFEDVVDCVPSADLGDWENYIKELETELEETGDCE